MWWYVIAGVIGLIIFAIVTYACYISHITRKAEEEYFGRPDYDIPDQFSD